MTRNSSIFEVSKPWHNVCDTLEFVGIRAAVKEYISRLIHQLRPNASKEWLHKLQEIVSSIEICLFNQADSAEEYCNSDTIFPRITVNKSWSIRKQIIFFLIFILYIIILLINVFVFYLLFWSVLYKRLLIVTITICQCNHHRRHRHQALFEEFLQELAPVPFNI
jgi:hypothetical protein